jgi:acyl carrier protein
MIDRSFGLRTEAVQETLARIWASVFGFEEIDVSANFFDLGGDSVIAAQIRVRIRESLNVDVPASAFFEDPGTIAAIAEMIGGAPVE